jgi:hypothetical protein
MYTYFVSPSSIDNDSVVQPFCTVFGCGADVFVAFKVIAFGLGAILLVFLGKGASWFGSDAFLAGAGKASGSGPAGRTAPCFGIPPSGKDTHPARSISANTGKKIFFITTNHFFKYFNFFFWRRKKE